MNYSKKNVVWSFILGFVFLIIFAMVSVLAIGYGWVPLSGKRSAEIYFGAQPTHWVASYAKGFTDHKIYFMFEADRHWVDEAVVFAGLIEEGEKQRNDCLLDASYPPWWFNLSPQTQGVCWRKKTTTGGMRMHYSPTSGFVYAFDFSS